MVHGRLTHELVENAAGWEFRPRRALRQHDLRFLLGFGVPFLVCFTALLSWVFHAQMKIASLPAAILVAACITLLCGGSAFVLIGLIMNASYRRLCSLTISHDGNLELNVAEEPDPVLADLSAALKQTFLGETRRTTFAIPTARLQAVQLCPWKVIVRGSGDHSTTWAVQGLLVLSQEESPDVDRLPILLTSDFVGAARLMQKLADVLHVPYLYHADAAGWQAETMRSAKRPPLRSGGMVS
jgi:hypothetical protein